MVSRQDIVSWLDKILDVERVRDVAVNGLQVEGRDEVRRVVTGVSANLALIEAARELHADLLVVHHGLVWGGIERITGPLRRRLGVLFEAGMSLAAYHLPLDMHPELGNNASLTRWLGLQDVQPFGVYKGQRIGFAGRLPKPQTVDELLSRCRAELHPDPLFLSGGDHPVETVALCSGGGADLLNEAIELGVDLFLSGEASEYSPALAEEAAVHVIAAGHHATEVFGVQNLAQALGQKFGIPCDFVDVPNAL